MKMFLVMHEEVVEFEDGSRPMLGLLMLCDEGYDKAYATYEEASQFIKDNALPLGWVVKEFNL